MRRYLQYKITDRNSFSKGRDFGQKREKGENSIKNPVKRRKSSQYRCPLLRVYNNNSQKNLRLKNNLHTDPKCYIID